MCVHVFVVAKYMNVCPDTWMHTFTTTEFFYNMRCISVIFYLPCKFSKRLHCDFIFFRLAVLGKLNNFVKEWIAEISELKVGSAGVNTF